MSERESDVYGTIGPSSARDALVALRNIEHLVRSPRVDHRVVEELLPELLSGLDALDTFFQCGGGDCPGEQVGALASASVGATRVAILGFSGPKRVNARLALERALRHEVRVLEGCVEVCDLCRRASGGQSTELTLRDVLGLVLRPGRGEGQLFVATQGDPLPFVCDTTVAAWLVRVLLQRAPAGSQVVAALGERGPELVVTRADDPPRGEPMVPRVPGPHVAFAVAARLAERMGCELRDRDTLSLRFPVLGGPRI